MAPHYFRGKGVSRTVFGPTYVPDVGFNALKMARHFFGYHLSLVLALGANERLNTSTRRISSRADADFDAVWA